MLLIAKTWFCYIMYKLGINIFSIYLFVQLLIIDDMAISAEIRLVSQRGWSFVGGATSQSL